MVRVLDADRLGVRQPGREPVVEAAVRSVPAQFGGGVQPDRAGAHDEDVGGVGGPGPDGLGG